MDQLPFWPPPDDTASGCSCNIAKVDKKELLIAAQMTTCTNNETNLDQMSSVDAITDYGQACLCCAESAIVSTYAYYTFCFATHSNTNIFKQDLGYLSEYETLSP
jgi:hypothetical protein